MVKRPLFWVLFALVSLGAAGVGIRYFPQAFPIVALDISMNRDQALAEARAIMMRDGRGPADYRQAASFAGDEEAQTFVELEGGGKDVFARMLREGIYSAYTWRVRQFKEGETNETTIRFTPEGRAYGFVERLKEDTPGTALDADAARRTAEREAAARWGVDFTLFAPIEQGQERRLGGRIDHTLTYERRSPTLVEGRYRLRLVVSGDRLTEVTHFIRIPEAFSRRYARMRSANEAIGIGSVVALALLYGVCGIGIGLFVMLRKGFVLWRHAMFWGAFVGLLQVLASVNEFPLLWMTYDTALPRATFMAQQIAVLTATAIGMSLFFALSFMAAETLTRRAFGEHPQLWRVWSKGPGSSTAILGRTMGGYLLVAVFFAYDVLLYVITTRTFGWWSPSEALLHPDVLATYAPWLSAIANSFQAGFWEESLFRAVPLAGAALIGDRFGKRNLFLVLGFMVQAIVFGAGHAPYPNQPSFARPVELLIPSIGFGLLYVYLGLLPGIVLHFAFDVVWFALPIFLTTAPGVWFQRAMVVTMTLVPLWIVLWRRLQSREWTVLARSDRNAAWMPPPATARPEALSAAPQLVFDARLKSVWFGLGAAGLLVCAIAAVRSEGTGGLTIGRQQAADIARRAIEQRGAALDRRWRFMPVPDEGGADAHEFVAETAGDARRKQLLGVYLPAPRWRVRVATFEGDVADRAEEWLVFVTAAGDVRTVRHTLPEGRPGAALTEDEARRLAVAAIADRLGLNVARADASEISARPAKLKARTDWTFTFLDKTVEALPKGELRVAIEMAGDEVAAAGRFVYVPDDWQRQARAAATRNTILRILIGLVFGGVLVGAAIFGVMAWSQRRFTPRLFVAGAGLMLVASTIAAANTWPTLLAALPTVAPLPVAIGGVAATGLVGLTIMAVLIGLALGAVPRRLSRSNWLPSGDVISLGAAAGLFAAGIAAAATWLRTPEWAATTDLSSLGTLAPIVQVAIGPITGLLTRMAVILSMLTAIDHVTSGWTRWRATSCAALALVGLLAAGVPAGSHYAGWLAAGFVTAVGLVAAYVTLLRFDLTMVPVAIGTMAASEALGRVAQRPVPGVLVGTAIAAVVVLFLGWWWSRALDRSRGHGTTRNGPAEAGHYIQG
ncbi:MAG: hypothetical protein ABJA98_05085 [Acidobacteriota bacterium]